MSKIMLKILGLRGKKKPNAVIPVVYEPLATADSIILATADGIEIHVKVV